MTGPSSGRTRLRGLRAAIALLAGAFSAGALMLPALAKSPGQTYCFYGKCHRVKTLAEMRDLVGTQSVMSASHYDSCRRDPYNPCGLTSSGERFDPDSADNAASPIYPDGTIVLVWSRQSQEAAVLRINNAGPYWGNRTLDVSRAAAERLGFRKQGVGQLEVHVLAAPEKEDATYKAQRKYDPVLGHIGKFESLAGAEKAVTDLASFEALIGTAFAPQPGPALYADVRPPAGVTLMAARTEPSKAKALIETASAARMHLTPADVSAATRVASFDPVTRRTDLDVKLAVPAARRSAASKIEARLESLSRSARNPLASVSTVNVRKTAKPVPMRSAARASKAVAQAGSVKSTQRPKPVGKLTAAVAMTANAPPAKLRATSQTYDNMGQSFAGHKTAFTKTKLASADSSKSGARQKKKTGPSTAAGSGDLLKTVKNTGKADMIAKRDASVPKRSAALKSQGKGGKA